MIFYMMCDGLLLRLSLCVLILLLEEGEDHGEVLGDDFFRL